MDNIKEALKVTKQMREDRALKHDLYTDNSTYIDTPFTLELKQEVAQLQQKLIGYKKATTQLNRIVAHRDEVISLRDITIHRLRCELGTIIDREESQARQRHYNNWANEVSNETITREDIYGCNP